MVKVIKGFYGENPQKSGDFARIINKKHFDRIMKLLDGQKYLFGGPTTADRDDLYIPPTIVLEPKHDSPIMQEEVFGPVASLIAVDSIEDAIAFVTARDKPLAMTCFSS